MKLKILRTIILISAFAYFGNFLIDSKIKLSQQKFGYQAQIATPYNLVTDAAATSATSTNWFGSIRPLLNNSFDLGSTTLNWRNIYFAGSLIGGGGSTISSTFSYVPVNTTTHAARVFIQGAGTENPFTIVSSTPTSTSMLTVLTNGNIGINSSSPVAIFSVQGNDGINPFEIESSTGASILSILTNGNIGINSTTPIDTLGVQGGLQVVGNASTTGILNVATRLNVSAAADSASAQIHTRQDASGQEGIQVDNANNGGSALAAVDIRNGGLAAGERLLLAAGGTSYNQVASWQDAGIVAAGSLMSGGLVLNGFSKGIIFEAGGLGSGFQRMIISSSTGNVGIGTSTPIATLSILASSTNGNNPIFEVASSSGTSLFRVAASGRVGVNSSSPINTFATQGEVSMVGLGTNITGNGVCITATGTITNAGAAACVPSGEQFKKDLKPFVGSAIDEIKQIEVKIGEYKQPPLWAVDSKLDQKEHIFLVAQQIAKIDPRLVNFGPDDKPLTLNWDEFNALYAKGFQEQQKQIEDNKKDYQKQIDKLVEKVDKLENRVGILEKLWLIVKRLVEQI